MTRDKAAKKAARDRAARTGESYTRARRAAGPRGTASSTARPDPAGQPAAEPAGPAAGDQQRWWHAYVLATSDRIGELRQCAEAGDSHAQRELAGWLADRGQTSAAIEAIRPLADAGDDPAQLWLARWLAECGEVDELRRRASAGDWHALRCLAGSLAEQGHLGELRELLAGHPEVLASDWEPASTQHQPEVLRLRAELGDSHARQALARAKVRAQERARAGDGSAQAD